MNGKPRTYIINFIVQGVDLGALTRYLHENREIIAYWNYLPLVYCVKSYLSANELADRLRPYLPHLFIIAEINPQNVNGILPQDAWSWFYMDHHHKQELPQGLLSGLGGLGGLGGLLPPLKK
jgi:hypothetical protein